MCFSCWLLVSTAFADTSKPAASRIDGVTIRYFKKYNDSLGHLEGDKALIATAKCLKNNIKRETDFVARFGGEEFVCVLPFIEKDEAFEFAKTKESGRNKVVMN